MNTKLTILSEKAKLFCGFFVAATFVASFSCCANKTGAAGDNDSISAENAVPDSIATTLVTYSDSTDFESVNIEVALPAETPENAAMLKSLWGHFDEVASRGYSDEKRVMPKYSGDWGKTQDIVDYYGKAIAQKIGAEAEKEYNDKVAEAKKHPGDPLYANCEKIPYQRDITMAKLADLPHHVVFTVMYYGYAGGAHGGTIGDTYTYDKATGKEVKDVLDPALVKTEAMQAKIRKGLCEYFKCKDEELNDNLQIGNPFEPKDKKDVVIPWPETKPFLTKDGVCFVYQQYEIAPYAAGMPSFTLPYDEVKKDLLVEP